MARDENTEPLRERRCRSGAEPLTRAAAGRLLVELEEGWTLEERAPRAPSDLASGAALVRTYAVKGFARAVYLANLAAFHADRENHHPDVTFGVGHCRVRYTTHDVDGLTENDFICAAKLDRLLA